MAPRAWEISVTGDDLLALLLPVDRLQRLHRLMQDLQFRLLVLEHAEFGVDPRLQIEDAFLIHGRRNRVDEALNGCKPAARVAQRLLRQGLLQGARLPAGQDLFLVGGR